MTRGRTSTAPRSPGGTEAVPRQWVLDEDDALELLAYLITAARTQVDEAAEYGPLRLLTAARRLAEAIALRASTATATATATTLTGPLADIPLLAVPREERRAYTEQLDTACRALAEHLLTRFGPRQDAGPPATTPDPPQDR